LATSLKIILKDILFLSNKVIEISFFLVVVNDNVFWLEINIVEHVEHVEVYDVEFVNHNVDLVEYGAVQFEHGLTTQYLDVGLVPG